MKTIFKKKSRKGFNLNLKLTKIAFLDYLILNTAGILIMDAQILKARFFCVLNRGGLVVGVVSTPFVGGSVLDLKRGAYIKRGCTCVILNSNLQQS